MDSIIFDVDGTMWDTTYVVADAWNACILEETGETYAITSTYLKSQFGKLLSEIADDLFHDKDPLVRQHLIEKCCNKEHEALTTTPVTPYEGMEEALRYLSQKYKLFLVSNCQAGYIELFLKVTNWGRYFTDHLCPGDTQQGKADNIKSIIKKHHLTAPVYVGDTIGDYNATKENNIPFVFAAYGFGNVPSPDFTINTPIELLSLFE